MKSGFFFPLQVVNEKRGFLSVAGRQGSSGFSFHCGMSLKSGVFIPL